LHIESPACIDNGFFETTNKELFQTPNLVTPSNELILTPSEMKQTVIVMCLSDVVNLNHDTMGQYYEDTKFYLALS
jgi:hypothetical protein